MGNQTDFVLSENVLDTKTKLSFFATVTAESFALVAEEAAR